MRIAMIGYGKMGKTIAKLALERGHEIVAIIDPIEGHQFDKYDSKNIDVAIEFTRPEAAPLNISKCIESGIPVVSGTTGWLNHLPAVVTKIKANPESALFYSSNFSLGVNIFFEVNRHLARLMDPFADYQIQMEEIHHTQKLDAPSGTAITLAEDIINNISRKTEWINEPTLKEEQLAITSKRINSVPGTHAIKYISKIDEIEIIHTAHSRQGFAQGAILAAEWVIGKSGLFQMQDMLNI